MSWSNFVSSTVLTNDITDLTPMSPCPLTSDVTSHTVAVVSALPVMNTDPSLANQRKVLRAVTNQRAVLTNKKPVYLPVHSYGSDNICVSDATGNFFPLQKTEILTNEKKVYRAFDQSEARIDSIDQ